jgi:SAM-dependent methyltransferase
MMSSPDGSVSLGIVRHAYEAALTHTNPRPDQLDWRLARFDRGAKLVREITERAGPLRGRKVVDLAAAHGGDCSALVAAGAWTVAADFLDYDYATLRRHLQPVAPSQAGLQAVVADSSRTLPFRDGTFDMVLALGLLEHLTDLRSFFREVHRILRADGLAIVDVHVALKAARRDPLYFLPITGLLPMPARRFVAERVCGRRYPFPLGNRTFYSSRTVARPAEREGFRVTAHKYFDSPIAGRLARWPLAPVWGRLLERYAYDFLLLRKGTMRGRTLPVPAASSDATR